MYKFYWLNQIKLSDRKTLGDKAFYLADLTRKGYPVNPGFVIPSNIFWQFLQDINWSNPLLADFPNSSLHFNVNDYRQLQEIAQSIHYKIVDSDLPLSLVSSLESAINNLNTEVLNFQPYIAFPHLENILEPIVCQAKLEKFSYAIKQIWAEIFNAKSLFYWHSNQLDIQQLQPTILVQPLHSAVASGNIHVFADSWEIQATHGLEVSMQMGQIIPDSYIISPENVTVKEKKLGNKILAYNLDTAIRKFSYMNTWQEVYHTQMPLSDSLPALQSFLLPENVQNKFALAENELQILLELTQNINNNFHTNFCLKWSLFKTDDDAESKLFITDFQIGNNNYQNYKNLKYLPKLGTTEKLESVDNTDYPIIKAIGASPGKVISKAIVIHNLPLPIEQFPEEVILVVSAIIPSYLPLLKNAAGIISEQGGMTSHAAILARELGIPAIVGATNATQIIQTGNYLLVNGNNGEVNLIDEKKNYPQKIDTELTESHLNYNEYRKLFPIASKLFVNLSQIDSIKKVQGLPIDGIGLLRSELMTIEILENYHPLWWIEQGRQSEIIKLMVDKLSQFAESFFPKPVFYRSLDLILFESNYEENFVAKETEELTIHDCGNQCHKNLDKSSNVFHQANHYNHILGKHGTLSYMLEPSLLDLEINILSEVHKLGYSNVHLILPYVRSVEEFQFCRNRIETKWKDKPNNFQIWIMAEVPSVLFLIPEYVKAGVQGIAIGTNDLTQLLLGVDREKEDMGNVFNSSHPAVMRAIHQLISQAKTAGIPCSICGDAPALYPEIIDDLIRWGITSISVNVNAVEQTYQAIARAEQRLILEAARLNNR
ncbi:MAG: putative PEP-binding protein [Trichodesmium sp.]